MAHNKTKANDEKKKQKRASYVTKINKGDNVSPGLPVKRKKEVLCSPITLRKPFKQPKILNQNNKNSIELQPYTDKLPHKLYKTSGISDTVVLSPSEIEEHLKKIDSKDDSPQASSVFPALSSTEMSSNKSNVNPVTKNTTHKVTPTTHVSKLLQELQFLKNEMKKREIFEKKMSKQLAKALTNIEQNRKMLESILNDRNEFKEIPSDQSSKVLEDKSGFPSIGFYRKSDKTIHIGGGIFLAKTTYDAAVLKATTPAKFVKKILISIFTPEELLDSSVKGGKSNRYKKETQKPGLDPSRLLAVKSIFEHFLKSQNNDPETVKLELKKTHEYISSKISDMRKTKPPQGKVKGKANKDIIDEEELEFELGNDGIEDQVENVTENDRAEFYKLYPAVIIK